MCGLGDQSKMGQRQRRRVVVRALAARGIRHRVGSAMSLKPARGRERHAGIRVARQL